MALARSNHRPSPTTESPPSIPSPSQAKPRHVAPLAANSNSSSSSSAPSPTAVHPSILQPRVAVVLNVPRAWHPWLFALRLLSILPAVWWGLPSALQLLLRLRPGLGAAATRPVFTCGADGQDMHNAQYPLAETALATIWSCASGYLSFFFTDCLMSRWLINYTPQATIVRLLTINAVNGYLTLTTLSFAGGFEDARLLLPGWIGIATTLTVCYHITHQKINIRKETSTSINVISIASYISMIILLIHVHCHQPGYPTMPVVTRGVQLWQEGTRIALQIKGSIERGEL